MRHTLPFRPFRAFFPQRSLALKQRFFFAFFFSLTATSCGYDCPAECESARVVLAEFGFSEDGRPLDPETVCENDAITSASSCAECEAAFLEAFRVSSQKIACDCPDESRASQTPEDFPVRWFERDIDGSCTQRDEPFGADACLQWRARNTFVDEMCFSET